jgi:phosphoglucosamine mutase
MGLERFLGRLGLALHRSSVGDRYVGERMRELGCNLGGEQSGHLIMSDFGTTGDGLVAALQVLAVLAEEGRPASIACRRFEPLPQRLVNIRYTGELPLADPRVRALVAEEEAALAGRGRILIRPSGTEPVIRVMVEAEDAAMLDAALDRLCRGIRAQCSGI